MLDRETFLRITHPDYVRDRALSLRDDDVAAGADGVGDSVLPLLEVGVSRAVAAILRAEVDRLYPEPPVKVGSRVHVSWNGRDRLGAPLFPAEGEIYQDDGPDDEPRYLVRYQKREDDYFSSFDWANSSEVTAL